MEDLNLYSLSVLKSYVYVFIVEINVCLAWALIIWFLLLVGCKMY